MNDTVGDASDASDMPETDLSGYTGAFSMLDDSQHRTKHAQHMHSMHKLTRSPLDANLQRLIPSPVYEQVTRPSEQQQHQKQQPPCFHQQPAQQQARQALQQPWLQQEQLQKGRLLNKQLHNGTASRVCMTGFGTKPSTNSTPNVDVIGNDVIAQADSIQSNASCRGGNLEHTELAADKENAQLPGRKGPVRKALFGEQGQPFTGNQSSAYAWPSEPACGPVHRIVDDCDAVESGTSAAPAEEQQSAKPAGQSTGRDTVDFSSVFDFL